MVGYIKYYRLKDLPDNIIGIEVDVCRVEEAVNAKLTDEMLLKEFNKNLYKEPRIKDWKQREKGYKFK